MMIKIHQGNCLDRLKDLEDQSINTCITSPPYWGLRDYGTAEWEGGDEGCDHKEEKGFNKQNLAALADKFDPHKNPRNPNAYDTGKDVAIPNFKNQCGKCGAVRKDSQLGLEDTPEEFVENLVKVFREVRRVLKDSGTVWLNLGDSYISGKSRYSTQEQSILGGGKNEKKLGNLQRGGKKDLYGHPFYKDKDLAGIPWRVAFALQADGWYLRQDIIWHKPNPMPESIKDRCTKAHEYIFLLSKNKKYYYDHEAIKEDAKFPDGPNTPSSIKAVEGVYSANLQKIGANPKRNKRSVWTVTTKPFKEAHFATFPVDLIEPCVLAGCPEKVCVECDTPYERKVEIKRTPRWELPPDDPRYRPSKYETEYDKLNGDTRFNVSETKDLGLQKQCQCKSNETKPGTVLDPFGGSGTTAEVANKHNRNAVLIELNEEYIKIMKVRLVSPQEDLFNPVELEVV